MAISKSLLAAAAGIEIPHEETDLKMLTMDIRQIKIKSNRKRRINQDKVNELRESIKQVGLMNPITLDKNNYLIAGHHRYQAMLALGRKDVPYTVLETDDALLIELAEIDENFIRYELTEIELGEHLKARKEIYEKLYPQTNNGGDRKSAIRSQILASDNTQKSFVDDTSEKLNKSQSTIKDSIKIAKDIAPEVKEMIYDTPLADQKTNLLELSRLEPEKQKQVVEAIKDNPKADVKEHLKQQKKEEERKQLSEIGKAKKIEIDFRLGDFSKVFNDIKDGSIDCIITDPPYPFEYINCWSELSKFAKRVLKPNGFCIAYSGQMHLPEVIKRMAENLDYYWTFAVYHEGQTQIVNGVNLICRWKPVLIFQNGKRKISNTIQDYFISKQREKDGHDWQQSESGVSYLIERFTEIGDTILEPFAGSGTTIKASLKLGRKIIASEINEETYNIAKAGLHE